MTNENDDTNERDEQIAEWLTALDEGKALGATASTMGRVWLRPGTQVFAVEYSPKERWSEEKQTPYTAHQSLGPLDRDEVRERLIAWYEHDDIEVEAREEMPDLHAGP